MRSAVVNELHPDGVKEKADSIGQAGQVAEEWGGYMLGKISSVALSKPHFPTDKRNHDQDAMTIGAAMIRHDTLLP